MWHVQQVSTRNTDEKGTHTTPDKHTGGLPASLTDEET